MILSLEDIYFRRKIKLTYTFSQMNTMIDITIPIPRNINAGIKK